MTLRHLSVLCLTGLVALGGVVACSRKPEPTKAVEPWDEGPPAQVYTVRGQIERARDASGPMKIHHEPIHGFVNRAGETVGMNAMVMDFPDLFDDSAYGLSAGAKVEFRMEVYWPKGSARWRAGAFKPLDSATELNFGKADPASLSRDYTVRGVIAELPDPAKPLSGFRIRHEAIDDFRDRDGTPVGMNAMTMSFDALAPGVTLEGLSVGDKVRFTIRVTYGADGPRYPVTSIERLDPGTELEFRRAQPPQN